MRYLIYGSGAVGSYLGTRLAHSGQQVGFLVRKRLVSPLQLQGIKLTGEGETIVLPSPRVYSDPAQAMAEEQPDLVLLTVKSYDVAEAAETLSPLLHPGQAVVSFTNGISNESTLTAQLGEGLIIPATLTTAVQLARPGDVEVTRSRGIGLGGDHPLLVSLHEELAQAGFHVRCYPDGDRMKWSKLLTNIVSNATSAILGWTPQQVFSHPVSARLEIHALREAVRVIQRLGFRPHNLPGVQVAFLSRAVFVPVVLTRMPLGHIVNRGRGGKPPSLHSDIGRGRSEVRWLNGAVAAQGAVLGVPTPVNSMLTEVLLELVHKTRQPQEFLDQPLQLADQVTA